jgi:hypothetical protein
MHSYSPSVDMRGTKYSMRIEKTKKNTKKQVHLMPNLFFV